MRPLFFFLRFTNLLCIPFIYPLTCVWLSFLLFFSTFHNIAKEEGKKMTWIIGYFYFQPLCTTNLWGLLGENRAKNYPRLVQRNFVKFLFFSAFSFYCRLENAVTSSSLPRKNKKSIGQANQTHSEKFEKTGIMTSFPDMATRVTCEKYASRFPDVVIVSILRVF